MSSNLASLVASLTAETSQWNSNLDKALKKFTDFHDSVASTMLEIGEVIGVGFAVDKIVDFSSEILNSAASLQRLSQETGAAVEDLAALQGAAKITGIDDLGNSLGRLAKAQGQVAQGNKQTTGAFAAIGISAAQVASLKPDELLLRVADAFQKYADGAGKSAVAQDIFGRGGQANIPLLDQGAAAIENLTNQVKALGGATSDEFAKGASAFEGDLARMKIAVEGVGESVLSQLLPSLDGAVQGFTTFIAETNDIKDDFSIVGTAIKGVAAGLLTIGYSAATVAADITNLFEGAGKEIGGYAAAIATLVKDGPTAAKKVLQDAHADIQALDDKYRSDQLKRETAFSDALGKIFDDEANKRKAVAAGPATNAPQVVLPNTEAIDELQKAIADLQKKASALDLSGGLKPSEVEAAQAALQFGKLHDAVAAAGAQGQVLAQQFLQAAAALDQAQGAAQAKKLTDQITAQITTFGQGTIAQQEFALKTGDLGKAFDSMRDHGVAARTELDNLYVELGKKVDAPAIAQLSAQLQTLQGNSAAAAAQLFDLQHAALASNVKAEGNDTAVKQLQDLKDATIAQAAFNDQQQKAATINTTLQAQLADIAARQATGAETDVQAAADQDAARQTAVAGLQAIQTNLNSIAQSSGLPTLLNQATQSAAGIKTLQSQTDQLATTLRTDFVNDASNAFADFIDGTKSAHDAFKSFMDDIFQQISQLVAKNLFQSLFSTSGSSGSGLGSIFADASKFLFGGAKAGGGPVTAGVPYLVGEEGPEPFIPNVSGTIIPNGKVNWGGGTSQRLTQNIYVQGQVTKRSARQLQLQSARQQRIAQSRLG